MDYNGIRCAHYEKFGFSSSIFGPLSSSGVYIRPCSSFCDVTGSEHLRGAFSQDFGLAHIYFSLTRLIANYLHGAHAIYSRRCVIAAVTALSTVVCVLGTFSKKNMNMCTKKKKKTLAKYVRIQFCHLLISFISNVRSSFIITHLHCVRFFFFVEYEKRIACLNPFYFLRRRKLFSVRFKVLFIAIFESNMYYVPFRN